MLRRYRQRRGPYAMAAPSVMPSVIRSLILLGLVLVVLYFIGKGILWLFGGGSQQVRTAVTMQVEDRGAVSMSLEGGLLQRAEGTQKLYTDDRITTGGNGNARLTFFDGSLSRIDVQSDVTIVASAEGKEDSSFTLKLAKGALWMRTPTAQTFSGAITRTIDTPRYDALLPSDTEAIIEENMLMVFNADGAGVELLLPNAEEPVFIGEGQQIELPEREISGDVLRYRSAIEPLAVQRDFIEESRTIGASQAGPSATASATIETVLTVSTPADNTKVTTATVHIEGTISPRVERVRVNSYDATINRSANSFTQELTLREEGETVITVEALDARGIVLQKITRTVQRGSEAIPPPAITSPAKTGETYRTSKTEFAITGTAPTGAAGIQVNEYKLQLFRAGDATWSYLASTALNNLKTGTNIYDVYTLDAQGQKSAPARITILLEAGTEGVVGSPSSAGTAAAQAVINEATLPTNAPLEPGTIAITAPAPGKAYTATGSEFLLEGTTSKTTASVWVNGYRLQLYKPGNNYWNYIAKATFNTLKPGTNVYKITARNEKGEILDTFEYTVTYNP